MTAMAFFIHSALLRGAAVFAAIVARRRAFAFASRMLTLIFRLNFFHPFSP
jgi:hypothetical protein